MARFSINAMRDYLSKSISSINQNKINGMLSEIDLRQTLIDLGFGDRISQGGWIARNVGAGVFGHHSVVLFPQTITPEADFPRDATLGDPPMALHTICSTMHQIGVHSYFCVPTIGMNDDPSSIIWLTKQLGIPNPKAYSELTSSLSGFSSRNKNYNFLRYHTDANLVPESFLAEEFTKEHLRIAFQNQFMSEMSDIDGIIWGQQYTYPIEIKEKTAASDSKVGDYFGIDVGPFVKLAFYAAKRGSLHSLFFVREINNTAERQLVNWWFITFDTLAQFASWIPQGGGPSMTGGRSSVVKIPKAEFTALSVDALKAL